MSEHFAANLRRLRQERGFSQRDLSIAAGLNPRCVEQLEQARRAPLFGTAAALAKALQVPMEAFLEEPKT